MRALLVFVIVALFNYALTDDVKSKKITCEDLRGVTAIGALFIAFSSDVTSPFDVKFYLSTNQHKDSVEINTATWSQLKTHGFDTSKRTYIIIHGFQSGGQKPWAIDLKDALLDSRQGNVIMVDWSDGSNKKNYVNAARNTIIAANRIFNFFQSLRANARTLNGSTSEILWNHLHFIGHSLGAQVSGQTANLLKKDTFWKLDRITGLDPARPCFVDVDPSLRVDKEHADFVDIIHTQIGKGSADALGLTEAVGHIDFYVNGGMAQPECQKETMGYNVMICSHRLAPKYFAESIRNSRRGTCAFQIQRWNGSYEDAQMKIDWLVKGLNCNNCPKMGIDAVKSRLRGVFLVITGSREPYCTFNPDHDLRNIIPGIRKLKGIRTIFDHSKPSNLILAIKG